MTGAAIALACIDPWRRSIILTEARWVGHVLVHHGELAPRLAAIEATLTSPTFVMRDRRRDDRKNSYRPDLLPVPIDHLYLKVVVEFGSTSSGEPVSGVIITAYPIPIVTEGETQLWP